MKTIATGAFPRARLPLLLLFAVVLTACGDSSNPDDNVAVEPSATSIAATATTATSVSATTPTTLVATSTAITDPTVTAAATATPAPQPTATPAATDVATGVAADRVEVVITEFAFAPQQLDISAGTTVVFTNRDPYPHTVTESDYPYLFDSKNLDTGESYEFTFDSPGVYEYVCLLHPTMRGTIVVS